MQGKWSRPDALKVSRRAALQVGGVTVLGGSALAALPLGQGAEPKAPSRLSAANFRKRYAVQTTKTPAAGPKMVDRVAHCDFTQRRQLGQVLTAPLRTPVLGSDGVFPSPRIEANQGTRAVVRQRNHLASVGPLSQPNKTSTHLHGSASLSEFAGLRRQLALGPVMLTSRPGARAVGRW